jgi:oxygen-independent coproporphyrinogen-3 oxidase
MSGIYIHIPFCKQACHYCDFHFSTSLKMKKQLLEALEKELLLRKSEFNGLVVGSVYLGGGTPSLLSQRDINSLLEKVSLYYELSPNAEITLEANPDDLSEAYVKELSETLVNRISLGVQSFNPKALKFMNRAHNNLQAKQSMEWVSQYFSNYSVDLIYGIPENSGLQPDVKEGVSEVWQSDIDTALSYSPKHISCYALTVEPKTALFHQINSGKIMPLSEQKAAEEYDYLKNSLKRAGYTHYEFSNFSLPGYAAVNNSGYWQGMSYIGIGPSAHSYNGKERSWNISNNTKYIQSLSENHLPATRETLSIGARYNEFVMTNLRTSKGISTEQISTLFGPSFTEYLLKEAQEKIRNGQLLLDKNGVLKAAPQAQFFTDGLAAHLFYID